MVGNKPSIAEYNALSIALEREVSVSFASRSEEAVEAEEDPIASILHVRPTIGRISSEFGMRKLPGYKVRQHRGIDIMAKRGTPVLASGGGVVIFSGRRGSFGNLVEVRHEGGMVTRYAHLEKMTVKRGQQVKPGAALGTVGRTGRTTGYNLHFEILVADEHIDPLSVVAWA
ncbi:MAG: hypothetical protein DELT_02851 [Desulfovibrio sp.]